MSQVKASTLYKIGDVSRLSELSVDTIRYYERIGLLNNVSRTAAGIRQYDDRTISSLKFIKRAQKMNFSLEEIGLLLKMRNDPQRAKNEIRQLTANKLEEVECHLKELTTLRNELQLLLNLCRGGENGCPIIEGIETEKGD